MPKLSELMGQNERLNGGILFNFDVQIDSYPADQEQELYKELQTLFARALSSVEGQLPHGVTLGIIEMEDIDTYTEDDYDRLGGINCNL